MSTLLTQEEADRYADGYIVVESNVILFMKYLGKIDGIQIADGRVFVDLAWYARWDTGLNLVKGTYDYALSDFHCTRQPGEHLVFVVAGMTKETVKLVLPGDATFAEFAHLLGDILVAA